MAKGCFCIGPQNGNPVCPCRMVNLQRINGRWVEVIDHGPAPEDKPTKTRELYEELEKLVAREEWQGVGCAACDYGGKTCGCYRPERDSAVSYIKGVS